MTMPAPPRVAVVGSGPSGCYLAQFLRKKWPQAEIVVIDRSAAPYGLIRYGVASDHQGTKAVTRQFDRLFQQEKIDFAGNVELGRDLTLGQLHAAFDVVVLATGLGRDRPLGIPGTGLAGVHGSGAITRALNSAPGQEVPIDFGERVVIVGGGNVAIDVLRFLIKLHADWQGSDINDELLGAYLRRPARHITVVSRSTALTAKSDPTMIRELGRLAHVEFRVDELPDSDQYATADKSAISRVDALRVLSQTSASAVEVTVDLRFGWIPVRIAGKERVESVEFAPAAGAGTAGANSTGGHPAHEPTILRVPADSVISAIGFELGDQLAGIVPDGLPFGPRSDTGRLAPALYRTGWVKRGPRGTIPDNRADGRAVAQEIIDDIESGAIAVHPDKAGFAALPEAVREQAVSFAEWSRLDERERGAAADGRVRRKIADHRTMVGVAKGSVADLATSPPSQLPV